MADEIIKYQFETNASEVAGDVNKLDNEFKGLNATFEDVYGDMQPLTGRLSQLQDRMYELAQAGDTTSREFRELSNEASRLKNVQKEVDLQLDRTARTMSEKFSSGVNLVTGSMVLAEGAMSAIGVSAEDSEKLMGTMFTTLATGQALLQVEEVTGWFSGLAKGIMKSTIATKAATIVQYLWNEAMNANPIGRVITVVAALVTGVIALTSWISANTKEAEANAKAIRDVAKANEEATSAMNRIGGEYGRAKKLREDDQKHQMDMAKAKGATNKELQAIEEKNRKENLEANKAAIREANAKAQQGNAESIKLLGQLMVEKEALMNQEQTIKNKYLLLDAQAKAAAAQKIADEKKAQEEKEKTEQAARDAAKAAEEAAWFKAEWERLDTFLEDSEEARVDARRRKNEGDTYAYNQATREENQRYSDELLALKQSLEIGLITQEEYDNKKKEAKTNHNEEIKEIDGNEASRKISIERARVDAEIALERELADKKMAIQQEYVGFASQIGSTLSSIAGDNEALATAGLVLEKGAAIAGIVINTSKSIAEQNAANAAFIGLTNAKYAGVPGGQIPAAIEIGVNTAMTAKNIARTKLGAGISIASIAATALTSNNGSIPSVPSAGSGGARPQSPTFNLVGQSAASSNDIANGTQAQIENSSENPVRAYVVSTDITSQQALDRATESQGELG